MAHWLAVNVMVAAAHGYGSLSYDAIVRGQLGTDATF